jgi:hypothetical protein
MSAVSLPVRCLSVRTARAIRELFEDFFVQDLFQVRDTGHFTAAAVSLESRFDFFVGRSEIGFRSPDDAVDRAHYTAGVIERPRGVRQHAGDIEEILVARTFTRGVAAEQRTGCGAAHGGEQLRAHDVGGEAGADEFNDFSRWVHRWRYHCLAHSAAPNPNFVGSLLDQGLRFGLAPLMYDANYRTPRSVQMMGSTAPE